jgi:hypothetical protein
VNGLVPLCSCHGGPMRSLYGRLKLVIYAFRGFLVWLRSAVRSFVFVILIIFCCQVSVVDLFVSLPLLNEIIHSWRVGDSMEMRFADDRRFWATTIDRVEYHEVGSCAIWNKIPQGRRLPPGWRWRWRAVEACMAANRSDCRVYIFRNRQG